MTSEATESTSRSMADATGRWIRLASFSWFFLTAIFLGWVVVTGLESPPSPRANLVGAPLGGDFVTFWTAPVLAGDRGAPAVWDVAAMHAREQEAIGSEFDAYAWFYPPTFLLLVWPLSWMPYLTALAVWSLGGLGAFLLGLGCLARPRWGYWPWLAFPGVFANLLTGQNGLWTSALLAAALGFLEGAPWIAGGLLGLLSFKPHLAALAFLALAAGRHYRALVAACVSAAGLAGTSWLAFGSLSWLRFREQAQFAWEALEAGQLKFPRMVTTYAGARLVGLESGPARVLQLLVALLAVALVWRVWRRGSSFTTRVSVLAAGTLLTTPFGYDYDLGLLALPLVLRSEEGAPRSSRVLLGLLFLLPGIAAPLAFKLSLPLAPLVLVAFLIEAGLGTGEESP